MTLILLFSAEKLKRLYLINVRRAVEYGKNFAKRPSSWDLWRQPGKQIAYVLFWIVVGIAATIVASIQSRPLSAVDWLRFGVILCCATIHLSLTRRQEESRRNRNPIQHIDVASIWTFPSVLLLPTPLTVTLLILIRFQRWFIARRPLYRFAFSTSMIVFSALVTKLVIDFLGVHGIPRVGWLTTIRDFGVIVFGALIYTGCQALIVAGMYALVERHPSARTLFGSVNENGIELFSLALGIVTAILVVNTPLAVLVMVPVSVITNMVMEMRQLQRDALTDLKTQLLNMRGWQDIAERELTRALKGGNSSALLMVDLDHFKEINDGWGHPAGDDVLLAVAGVLRDETRASDVVGRFGGEEFVVLLPNIDGDEALAVAERIRMQVNKLTVSTKDRRGRPTEIAERSTSVGVALAPADATTLPDLVQAADAAVYEAKDGGRNQVRRAGP